VERHGVERELTERLSWCKRAWSELPTASRRQWRNSCWPELWKTRLRCGRVKLNRLESTSGPLRCSSSAGLGFRGSEGG
jgi:hypothetical protein